MHKVTITDIFRPVPSPMALIVSIDEHGKPNIMTVGEIFNVGLRKPAIIGTAIRKATYTHGLISKTGAFTVNFPTSAMLSTADLIGTISGRNGLDKFAEYGLTPVPSDAVAPPIIAQCPVNLECKLLSVTEVGDHDLFLGEVLAMHVDADKVADNEHLLVEKLDVPLFTNWEYYRFGEKLGRFGYTRSHDK